jgi:hypothetical protein
LNSALEYTIRKVKGNQVRLKFTGIFKLLFYAYDVNILAKKNAHIQDHVKIMVALLDASKKVRQEVNAKRKQVYYTHVY